MPWQTIKKTIQQELGRPIEEVYLTVDPVPLASASVAQVHCAGVTGFCFLAPILQVSFGLRTLLPLNLSGMLRK